MAELKIPVNVTYTAPQGMWILYAPHPVALTTCNFRCSVCRAIVTVPGFPDSKCAYEFCPYCGARNRNPHETE